MTTVFNTVLSLVNGGIVFYALRRLDQLINGERKENARLLRELKVSDERFIQMLEEVRNEVGDAGERGE